MSGTLKMDASTKASLEAAALERLTKIRTRLIFEKPFLGALAVRLELAVVWTWPTAFVDGKQICFNPVFASEQSFEELYTIYAHEVFHAAMRHPYRRGERDWEMFNTACDYAINPLLKEDGFFMPDHATIDLRFRGMSAEDIYAVLEKAKEQQEQQEQEQQGAQGAQGEPGEKGEKGEQQGEPGEQEQEQGEPGEQEEEEQGAQGEPGEEDEEGEPGEQQGEEGEEKESEAPQASKASKCGDVMDAASQEGEPSAADLASQEEEWGAAVAAAATQAKAAGHGSAGAIEALRNELECRIGFEEYLALFAKKLSTRNLSWSRPNRRYAYRDLHLPSSRGAEVGTLVCAIDTSGSITTKDLQRFLGALRRLQEDLAPSKIRVIQCDDRIQKEEEFSRNEPVEITKASGRGGTSFIPVFERVRELQESGEEQVDGVIYLTDMDGYFPPAHEVEVEVLWVAVATYAGFRVNAPFGEVIKLIQ